MENIKYIDDEVLQSVKKLLKGYQKNGSTAEEIAASFKEFDDFLISICFNQALMEKDIVLKGKIMEAINIVEMERENSVRKLSK